MARKKTETERNSEGGGMGDSERGKRARDKERDERTERGYTT